MTKNLASEHPQNLLREPPENNYKITTSTANSEIKSFIEAIYEWPDRPKIFLAGAIKKQEAYLLACIYEWISPKNSLEWGLGSGISAAVFSKIRNQNGFVSPHIVLNPYQKQFSSNWGITLLENFCQSDSFSFLPEFAECFLVDRIRQRQTFDFIFIDGSHDPGRKMAHVVLANDCLVDGGYIAMHDSYHSSTFPCIRYLVRYCGYSTIPLFF